MKNIKIELEYAGNYFFGWEKQPGKRTVRGVIESFLTKILNEKIKLTCASRTDAGVHALGQVANFKTNSKMSSEKIHSALLGLPKDIYVKKVEECPLEFNSRKSISKVYLYKVLLGRSPIFLFRVYECPFHLDLKKISEALPLFLGTHSFDLFSYRSKGKATIKRFDMHTSDNLIEFEIEGDRFLTHMVRMIMGAIIEIGRNKLEIKDIEKLLEGKYNRKKPMCLPPYGLYLKEVKY